MQETLNAVKQFESSLKKALLETFGTFLPEDKVALLNISNYTSEDLVNKRTDDQIRGEMTRMMMDDLIEVECFKEITLDDGTVLELPYGQTLQETLVEYYTQKIAKKYGFMVDALEGLELEDIEKISAAFDGKLDEHVFTEDAIKLLEPEVLKELVEKYDEDALDMYFNRVLVVADVKNDVKAQNQLMKESVDRTNAVQIIMLNDKKFVKYIDQTGKVHLTEIPMENSSTEAYYQQRLANLKPGEKLDPEEFYAELQRYATEMTLTQAKDVDKDFLNHEQVDMLSFINSNEQIKETAKQDIVTHNKDMNIHVIEATDDIIVSDNKSGYVDARLVKDGDAIESDGYRTGENISSDLLSKQQYEELCMRYARGEELTLSELEALRRATIEYGRQEEKPTTLVPSPKPNPNTDENSSGFALKTFALYFVLLVLFIASFIAILLYK